ncbi:hypothetical protein ACFQ4I_26570, partial [Methylorubrum suomiense]
DARAFRAALGEAMRAHPELAALWRADPAIARDLEALDARLFGQDPTVSTAPSGDLPRLAQALTRSRRPATGPLAPEPRLAPLDGPVAKA